MIAYNDGLYEIDPSVDAIPEDKHICFFKEDMLQLKHDHRNRLLDVGWFPSGDLQSGEYALHLHEGDWIMGRKLHEFRTRNRQALVAEIERLLLGVVDGTA